jgi:hypothetical protein
MLDRSEPGPVLARLLLAIVLSAVAVSVSAEGCPAVLTLARAVEGEGAGLFADRQEVGIWVAHTAMNRVESDWWADSVGAVVLDGFHGQSRVLQPSDWAIDLARKAMDREQDIAQGALFVLSGEDLSNHGWSTESTIHSFEQDGWSLHFFREWPGNLPTDATNVGEWDAAPPRRDRR